MWTKKYRSQLLLVSIKTDGFRLTLPLSLYVLEELVNSLCDLLELADYIIPRTGKVHFRVVMIAKICRTMISELRNYGRWEMVEVEAANTRIHVGFY